MARFLVFVVTMLIMAHWFGSIWFWAAKLANFEPRTWVVRIGIQDHTTGEKYLFSFYWAVTTMFTIGYGDINALTDSKAWT